MSSSASSGERPPLAPPFFATQPPTGPAPSTRPETPARAGVTEESEAAPESGAGFPWEGGEAGEESELVLSDVVKPQEAAGDMVLTEIVETTEQEEAEAGSGGFPEEAIFRPDTAPAPTGAPGPVSTVHDPEAAAERLEQLARRIRHGGPEGLAQLVAASDRFEAVVAAVVAGYFAGLHDRRR